MKPIRNFPPLVSSPHADLRQSKTFRKITLIGILLLLITIPSKAQDKWYEVKISTASNSELKNGSIQISVLVPSSFYVFSLYDKAPWEDGKILFTSGQSAEKTYTFKDLANGNYYLYVQLEDGTGAYEPCHLTLQ